MTGTVDPEIYLPKMLDELDEAGLLKLHKPAAANQRLAEKILKDGGMYMKNFFRLDNPVSNSSPPWQTWSWWTSYVFILPARGHRRRLHRRDL